MAIALRTEVGVSRSHFLHATGIELQSILDMQQVHFLQREGFVKWTDSGTQKNAIPTTYRDHFLGGYLQATEKGRSMLDTITPMLLRERGDKLLGFS